LPVSYAPQFRTCNPHCAVCKSGRGFWFVGWLGNESPLEPKAHFYHLAVMVWDLGKAMRKKEEFESGRLMDFAFRQRVRATRLLARNLGLNETWVVGEIALRDDEDLLDLVAEQTSQPRDAVASVYGRCLGEARQQLIAERGGPTPNRLG
jgi:hypothetical protein